MSLTIVIPTIKRDTLQRALNSVRSQTVFTENIVMIDNHRYGASKTRNKAIRHVRTEWVGFLDDDDYLEPRYHEWLRELSDADMVIFQMRRHDGLELPGHTDIERLAYNWVGISFALRTSIAKQYHFKNMVAEDFDLIQRVKKAGYRLVVSPQVAYFVSS